VSARSEILASVRRALSGAPEPPRAVERPRADPPADLAALFAERVADYRATVERVSSAGVAAAIALAVQGCSVVVPPGLPHPVPGARTDDGLSATDLDAIDAVVTTAAVGIALTGTIVLDSGPGQGRRALTLVPDRHVCIVRASQIVPAVPDAVAVLDPVRPLTWISGPSATSDIELSRVEGVHGPRTLHVLLVTDA
jgi:L-lactate dehydrogenase complex protein LldG